VQHIFKYFTLISLLFISLFAIEKPKILTPEEAFELNATQTAQGIQLHMTIAQGVYLYDDKLKLELLTPKPVDLTPHIPRPQAENFHDYQTQRRSFDLFVPKSLIETYTTQETVTLKMAYQGCAEIGICYQPQAKELSFEFGKGAKGVSEQEGIAAQLSSGNVLWVMLSFFGFGLLLSLTPCVFPMIPILSSIIVSQPSVSMGAKKGFLLSLIYVVSMSAAYTIAGVLAALFGANLQASMQNPWVIGLFSAFFVVLALSMFGFYEIKMPGFIQNKLSKKSDEAQSQGVVGIAIMGFLSALIVGPCVAAPLAGALMYIGQTGNAFLGGAALFVMSMGMGVPLLIIGTTAGRYMPRPGVWMQNVTAFFGVMLLGVAIWMLSRIVPSFASMFLWMLLVVCSSVYFGALEPFSAVTNGWKKLMKSLLFLILLYGIALFVGVLSGATNPLSPLEKLTVHAENPLSLKNEKQSFESVKTLEELTQKVQSETRTVMVDFYADWCVNCVEFEQFTFSDPRVRAKLEKALLLKVDVTHNSNDDKTLQKHFGIYGPPAILFFKNGKELSQLRLVGYKNADEFLAHLEKAGL
jgi:thiol:disulfide interchange protein DsbD